ncbi:Non-structural maintenance of chromosomes element 1-like protein [Cryptotermes secundus]|uniref:Non-structural maintenance of chromosomes element 1 homolog n=2 Tax=Cryptotermes secundus TaxID=105785 RepID=A0A2J7PSD1_9NEOP|nr:Non-structural maintenance of chromosomes element 1-like protein [Cryptotermes secundus]PNF19245.1 Non-structural maintenance of chromosomes element 1-like protein [Cryptotermes secundus]
MLRVPSNYRDLHKRFLQILMNRRMVSYEDAFRLFCKMYQSEEPDEEEATAGPCPKDMELAVSIINKVIKGLNMEIRCAQDEITPAKYYLLVNTVDSHISRTFSKFSAAELEFFKTVLSEIVTSEDGCISSTACLNLNSSLPGNMTKSDTEALLEKFCKYQWLYQKDGKVHLTILSIVELEPLILSAYEDYVNICRLCKRIVMQGYRCDRCLALLHLHCVHLYTKGVDRIHSCPVCSADQPEMLAAVKNIPFHSGDDNRIPSASSRENKTGKGSARK